MYVVDVQLTRFAIMNAPISANNKQDCWLQPIGAVQASMLTITLARAMRHSAIQCMHIRHARIHMPPLPIYMGPLWAMTHKDISSTNLAGTDSQQFKCGRATHMSKARLPARLPSGLTSGGGIQSRHAKNQVKGTELND